MVGWTSFLCGDLPGKFWIDPLHAADFHLQEDQTHLQTYLPDQGEQKRRVYYKNILPQKALMRQREDVGSMGTTTQSWNWSAQQNETFRKEFLQNLSHEFKTPIFAIQGYVDTFIGRRFAQRCGKHKIPVQSTSRNVERWWTLLMTSTRSPNWKRENWNSTCRILWSRIRNVKEVYESLSLKADEKQISCTIKKVVNSPARLCR